MKVIKDIHKASSEIADELVKENGFPKSLVYVPMFISILIALVIAVVKKKIM